MNEDRPKVVAAHREGDWIYLRWNDGSMGHVEITNLANGLPSDADEYCHVWQAIIGTREHSARTMPQADGEDAKTLKAIRKVLAEAPVMLSPSGPAFIDNPRAVLSEIQKILDSVSDPEAP